VAQISASILTLEGIPSKFCLGGGIPRTDASVPSERYLPALSTAQSTATRFLLGSPHHSHSDRKSTPSCEL